MVALGSAICAGAFAFACYAPPRIIAPIALISAVAVVISQSITLQGFSRAWATALAAFFIGLVSYTVAGRMRVPPLVVVVSAVVPMLPGISIYRGLALLGGGDSMASEGLLAMATAALGRDRDLLRRDPRGVRRAAAQAGGASRGEPAGRSAPGRSAAGPHRSRPAPGAPRRVRGALRTPEAGGGQPRQPGLRAAVVRRAGRPSGRPAPGRTSPSPAGRPRRGSRSAPGGRRTRPRRRSTPARWGPDDVQVEVDRAQHRAVPGRRGRHVDVDPHRAPRRVEGRQPAAVLLRARRPGPGRPGRPARRTSRPVAPWRCRPAARPSRRARRCPAGHRRTASADGRPTWSSRRGRTHRAAGSPPSSSSPVTPPARGPPAGSDDRGLRREHLPAGPGDEVLVARAGELRQGVQGVGVEPDQHPRLVGRGCP